MTILDEPSGLHFEMLGPISEDQYGPALGADPYDGGTRFALWTSKARDCAVRLFDAERAPRTLPLVSQGSGVFALEVLGVGHGARYAFVLDGEEVRDPYAKFLPDGVDAPAMVWRSTYDWKHVARYRPLRQQVLYELHVGAFTPGGTYRAAVAQLPYLAELGVTAIELMPIGAFAGARGWGYDVVAHYAPFAPYGDPDELRAFIDAAHGVDLAVLLDVVYNHFGPSGNVLSRYGSEYFSPTHKTAWGDAPNFAHPAMRRYAVRNARYWLEEFRLDGLRFDAVHAIVDPSERHVLAEIADDVDRLVPKRLLIAEDDRNDPQIVRAVGFDGVWADDFHHQVRVALAGERDGYYAAYHGTARDLADTIENGWFYRGATYPLTGRARGKDASDLPAEVFIYCIQNHDQIGNRAFGDRLTQGVSSDAVGAATMLLLFLPMTPLLFMGQEWGASTPFLFFTDHAEELGRRVTEGRRREFACFSAFSEAVTRLEIPDPQDVRTFDCSCLRWEERSSPEHAQILRIHRDMLKFRATDPVLRDASRDNLRAYAKDDLLVVERWLGLDVRTLFVNLGSRPASIGVSGLCTEPRLLLATDGNVHWRRPLESRSARLVCYRRAAKPAGRALV
jgi:maltooligosyltrehalose trehalohydrolase